MSKEQRKYSIGEDDLEDLIKYCGSALVGKILKRFEIHDNIQVIKAEVKELIYEDFRKFRDMIIAHSYGMGMHSFRFIKRPNQSDK